MRIGAHVLERRRCLGEREAAVDQRKLGQTNLSLGLGLLFAEARQL
jgi:hypothetical protein